MVLCTMVVRLERRTTAAAAKPCSAPSADDRASCTSPPASRFLPPQIVVAAVTIHGDSVLLCRRGIEPRKGTWGIPQGQPGPSFPFCAAAAPMIAAARAPVGAFGQRLLFRRLTRASKRHAVGFLELGETLQQGIAREALEEANAVIRPGPILAVYEVPGALNSHSISPRTA